MILLMSLFNRKIVLIIVLYFTCSNSYAQSGKNIFQTKAINFYSKDTIQQTRRFNAFNPLTSSNIYYLNATENRNTLPQNHYITSLGFFCKKEWLIEKSTKMPLRFRLGSLSYCNKLEGKER